MVSLVLQRIASALLLLFVISTLTFTLVYAAGQNVARSILGDFATEEQIQLKNTQLGLDRPLAERYVEWLAGAVRGDFGTSWFSNEPVTNAILTRLPVTLSLVIIVILLTAVLAVGVGVASARGRGARDRVIQTVAVLGYALPSFILAIVLVTVFAVNLRWLPATGFVPFTQNPGGWALSLLLPVTALLIGTVASTAQQVRSAMIDVLQQDWVRTLRSRGLGEREIVFRHVLRAAAPAGFTVLALQFVGLMGGTVLIEQIFALPGMGFLAIQSTTRGDLPVILGVVLFNVIVVIIVNLVIDLVVAWLNPKVRIS